jgi:hypothetical protein
MTTHAEPPDELVDRVRALCADLPDAREHEAWTGTSWRIGTTTFAHVVQIADGRPPAYAKAFATAGPATVVTFQAPAEDRDALRATGHPYHLPPWRPGIVGVVIEDATDWTDLAERIEDSYRECGGRRARKE